MVCKIWSKERTVKYTLDTADVQTVTFGSIITASLATIPTAELYSLTDTFVRRRGCWNNTAMDAYPNDTWHEFGILSSNLYTLDDNGNPDYRKKFDIIEEILDLMNARLTTRMEFET